MVMVGSSPPEQQSPYGDGRYLLRMLLGQRTAPAQQMAPELGTQAVGPPTPLGELPSDVYVDDPAAMAEINPLAAAPAPARTPPTNIPMARPGVPNIPMARPAASNNAYMYNVPTQESPSQPAVRGLIDTIRTQLGSGNEAYADPWRDAHEQRLQDEHERRVAEEVRRNNRRGSSINAIDNIDGNPAPSSDEESSWYTPLIKGGIAAALIAAILSGRGRSAMSNSSGSGSVVPTTPGMDGVVIPPDRLSGPNAGSGMSPSPAQIETDILSVTPNELPSAQTGVATRPNDAPVAQGRPQSVAPNVINQPGPNAQRGLSRQGVQYRGRTYYRDAEGNIVDRNGDIVNTSATETIRKLFSQQSNQPGRR